MRDPLPAPERHPSLTLIAVGSEIGADRIAWDVAEQLTRRFGIPHRRCHTPATELPGLLRDADNVTIIDALLVEDGDQHIQLVEPSDLLATHRGSASHGIGIGEILALLHVIDELPAKLRLLGLPINPNQDTANETQAAYYTEQLADLLAINRR